MTEKNKNEEIIEKTTDKIYSDIVNQNEHYEDANKQQEELRLKRSYRKSSELPRPDLPASSEANRTKNQIKLRLHEYQINNIEIICRRLGVTRNFLIEYLIENYSNDAEAQIGAEIMNRVSGKEPSA